MNLKEIDENLSKVRWGRVGLIAAILLVLLFIWMFGIPQIFSSGWKTESNIGLQVYLDPWQINNGEQSKLTVKVKNFGDKNANVSVVAMTNSDDLLFPNGKKTSDERSAYISSGESRDITFVLTSRESIPFAGEYSINVYLLRNQTNLINITKYLTISMKT